MNLKSARSLMVCVLPLCLPLFTGCIAPSGESEGGADTEEGSVGVAAQAVVTTARALQISAAQTSTLAVMSDGTISSWGDNSHSQLGYATSGAQTTPASIGGLSGFKSLAAGPGSYSLALKSNGTVFAWGSNVWGQLGINMTSSGDQATPTQVYSLSNVTAVSAAFVHALALRSNGSVAAWGFNGNGQLGCGNTGGNYNVPVEVQQSGGGPLTGITAVVGGNAHSLALKSDGTVVGWGWNGHGEVGNGNAVLQNAATHVMVGGAPLSGITAVATGGTSDSSFALASDGTVWAWGNNGNGQMGNGTMGGDQYTPAQVMVGGAPLSGVAAVVVLNYSVLALKLDGTVWGWGNNDGYCELARTGGPSATPAQLGGLSGVTALAGATWNAFARTSDGKIWAWGNNSSGQLGDGTTTTVCTPKVVIQP